MRLAEHRADQERERAAGEDEEGDRPDRGAGPS